MSSPVNKSPIQPKIPSPTSAFEEVYKSPPGSPATALRLSRIAPGDDYPLTRCPGMPNLLAPTVDQTASYVAAMVIEKRFSSPIKSSEESTTNHFKEKEKEVYSGMIDKLPAIPEDDDIEMGYVTDREESSKSSNSSKEGARTYTQLYEEVPQWKEDSISKKQNLGEKYEEGKERVEERRNDGEVKGKDV